MLRFIKKLTRAWRTYLIWGFVCSVVFVPLTITMVYMSMHEGDSSRPYVPELRKIARQTPLYPGFQKTGENITLKDGMAYFSTYYQCDAQFADVQAFYARALPQQGWAPPKRTNSFLYDMNDDHYRRGDYFIAVDHDGSKPNNFSIVFIWSRQ